MKVIRITLQTLLLTTLALPLTTATAQKVKVGYDNDRSTDFSNGRATMANMEF